MLAALYCLKHIVKPSTIVVHSDSQDLTNKISNYYDLKSTIKNYDVLTQLNQLNNFHSISWKWVKGHSTHTLNVLADTVARDLLHSTIKLIPKTRY
jgi:ribonuclease HI